MAPLKSATCQSELISSLAFASPKLLPTYNASLSSLLSCRSRSPPRLSAVSDAPCSHDSSEQFDVIVIGSGLGGLSTAALLSSQGRRVCVLEAHDRIGGAAHSFSRRINGSTVKFESGPHLFTGLEPPSRNPLAHVLQATDTILPVIPYSEWGVFLSGEYCATSVRTGSPFLQSLLSRYGSPSATAEMAALLSAVTPAGELASGLPPALVSTDAPLRTLRTLLPRLLKPSMLSNISSLALLLQPFDRVLNQHVTDPFVNNFLNLLCFLLAGVDASRIPVAEVAFMLREWVSPHLPPDSPVLHHPVGGASAIAQALADTVLRHTNSRIKTRARVAAINVGFGGKVTGVRLSSGEELRAPWVISNVSALDLPNLLPPHFSNVFDRSKDRGTMCHSFMHLHVVVPVNVVQNSLPAPLIPNYASVEDWALGLDDPNNVVLVSVPSQIDPTVSSDKYVVAHAYTPATEPFDAWARLKRGTVEYEIFKKERSEVLWKVINRIFGADVAKVSELSMVGTPLTHAHYLNRKRGSYGPSINAALPNLGLPFPKRESLPEGLLCVGDGVFPGIGVPAVAGSAWLAANSILSLSEQDVLLKKINV